MQTSYNQYNDELQLGRIYDTSLRQIDSFLAVGAIGIAKAVIRSTDPARQVAQAGTGAGQGALIIGVAILSETVEQSSAGVVAYADKEAVPVMRKGRVVVETNDAVVAGAVANFHLASGKWTDEAVAAGIEATPQLRGRFVTGTTAAGLAAVEFVNILA